MSVQAEQTDDQQSRERTARYISYRLTNRHIDGHRIGSSTGNQFMSVEGEAQGEDLRGKCLLIRYVWMNYSQV